MDDGETPVHRLWRLFEERRWEEAGEQLHEDLVAEWPNVGHRFRGREHFLAMNRAHPAQNWHIDVRRVVAGGDQVAAEVVVTSDDAVDVCLGFYELRDGRILRATEYWVERTAQPIPQWRAAWTEPMDPTAQL
jgi:ketosteroid isomerase-like protein